MTERVTVSNTKNTAPVSEGFGKADQEALKTALDNYVQQTLFNILSKTNQRVNDEFKESLES